MLQSGPSATSVWEDTSKEFIQGGYAEGDKKHDVRGTLKVEVINTRKMSLGMCPV